MTQEQKQLLLQDLCARLPYGVKIRIEYPFTEEKDWHPEPLFGLDLEREVIANTSIRIEEFKPYLRPMSSMDSEEIETYRAIIGSLLENSVTDNVATLYNFLNSKHLDYRGMIHMGLALEAPEGMYNTK